MHLLIAHFEKLSEVEKIYLILFAISMNHSVHFKAESTCVAYKAVFCFCFHVCSKYYQPEILVTLMPNISSLCTEKFSLRFYYYGCRFFF
jgi:hypothetical protein